ncbi:Predicted lipoprotein [Filimonas lacunae]|uniref:Predicted lipoprotein n=1 Tax=Filimonas lacunae TaxID=477680 RepID=A0A173MD41_9BACT|nr:imelysin family protein [Filimonas lacunae]BAV05504.1 iron-regulated protein A precursor [Filimonas lacunae]SIT20684.1 Predicted lipoprotein [Filimonas lacunae]
MKQLSMGICLATLVLASSCKKSDDTSTTTDFTTLEQQVLSDFTAKVAVKSYLDLKTAAANLNTSLVALNSSATEANLTTARTNWKALRLVWEQCEGFLIGPVEDNDYDPSMDTWPTDYTQMDAVLADNSKTLSLAEIQGYDDALKGFHPIEYIIFGNHGDRKATDITARQKQYMLSLSADVVNICNNLYDSWTTGADNFAAQVATPSANGKYKTRKEVFSALVDNGLIGICDEVGGGKMLEPFEQKAPEKVESPYSGNSTIDFKNNIIGIQNVYIGINGSTGLNVLIAAKNKDLDNRIQASLTAAINSFDNIKGYYEDAILNQSAAINQTMTLLVSENAADKSLKSTLSELDAFILQYIKD